ncbi:ThuA domain-containing protein [Cyclobacterium salsum]|uniref:ThuA domain-containing protein n=1 Tax=Cyclobacterium salsum TaxID=2666329 RepID=UPI001391F77A|nr:ThuA domain-containing protein [Cyclobacterium salsum]
MKATLSTLALTFLLTHFSLSQDLSVLVLTGGHGFNRPAFFEMMDDLSGIRYTEMAHPEAREYFLERHHGEFDVLVFYDMIQDISPEEKKGFEKLVKKGIGLVFLHHAIVSYQDWDFYRDILGGRYVENDGDPAIQSNYKHEVDFKARIVNRRNNILNGVKDFDIYDEIYGNVWISETINPLLSTEQPGSMPILAWTQQPYRHTRSVYIQPGHGPEVFFHPMYRKLLAQSIYWASGK